MSLKVKDVMKRDVVTIGTDATVREATELMSQHQIGCLIVLGPIGPNWSFLKQKKSISVLKFYNNFNINAA